MSNYINIKNNLIDSAYKNKIPLVGEFEITANCNFSCAMCYAKSNDKNLTKEEWLNIFDQSYHNGMLFATLTGGEIFVNPDFIYLYEYLYDLGVKITLYTNGSLLTKEILEVLKKRKPELVAITLYGFDKISYLDFTKKDSFELVSKNIDLLKKNNINIVLRTIPLPKIYKNLDKIINFVKEKKLFLGYFLYVSKTKKNIQRLNAKELLDYKKRIEAVFYTKNIDKKDYICGAFKNSFFINHKGYMQGCSMMPYIAEKVNNNFLSVFNRLGKEWDALVKKSPCFSCHLKSNCFTCLARRYSEGNMFACSAYLKEYAERCFRND